MEPETGPARKRRFSEGPLMKEKFFQKNTNERVDTNPELMI